MTLKPFQEKIIQLLIQQESRLSELYTIFALQFQSHGKFFTQLAREETRHAALIQKMYDAALKGKLIFNEGKTKTYTLNIFLDRLESLIAKAQNQEFTLKSALACAVDYETSLIEKNIFSYFDTPSEKVKATLKILQSETLDHVERVRKAQSALSS